MKLSFDQSIQVQLTLFCTQVIGDSSGLVRLNTVKMTEIISSFLKAFSILWALITCHVRIILIAIETLILRETEDSYVLSVDHHNL